MVIFLECCIGKVILNVSFEMVCVTYAIIGKREHHRPYRIKDTLKRALWTYSLDDSHVKLDNGVEYSSEDMKAFKFTYKPRKEKE